MPDKDNSHPPTRLTWGEVKRIYEDCQARGVPPPLEIVRVIEPIVKKAEELSKTFNAIERSMSYAKVAFFGFIYQKTSNPLYVWQCIKFCLERGLTLPKWAQSYLLSAAVDLTDIKPYSKDPEQQVYRASKFSKNSNRHSLTRASELEKQFDAVEHFLKLRDSGQTWVEASERTGEKYAVSGKTVQEWVAKYRSILEAEIPTDLAS